MLDPWIFEEIRRREEDQRQRDEQRSRLEIHIETPNESDERGRGRSPGWQPPPPSGDRGVTIIDYGA